MPIATAQAAKKLLTPNDHALIMIDHQSQMAFATRSIDLALLRNNAALVAKAAAEFKVPTILTTVAANRSPARSSTKSSPSSRIRRRSTAPA